MKHHLLIILAVGIAGCASPKIPGESLVNNSPALRSDTLRSVTLYEQAQTLSKAPVRVIDTKIVRAPRVIRGERGTGKVVNNWTELWTVKRGDTNYTYRIQFDAKGSKGTDILVGPEDSRLTNGPPDIIDIK